ncbi:ETC complex I subunit conserved region-domain-containing protein [Gorgonomyces haynaldii]|nr:ETC complex I subunit conserved region-domain-containing protein [Gorgonomyces haynaldii]
MFFGRVLRQASVTKTTTGIFGLAVHPNPRPELISLYQRILHSLQRLPQESVYRQKTESLFKQRLDTLNQTEDVTQIENTIGGGQLEELIAQAKGELALIPQLEEWKPWEKLEEAPLPGQWEYPGRK